MEQTWRWFGPDDPVELAHVRQAGATGIVTALHQIPVGEAWPTEEILKRKAMIETAGLRWSVVESIPVHESIKTRQGEWRAHIGHYKDTLSALAAAGIETICYNFMAITDWSRTDLEYPMPQGGTALRFDAVDFAAYDLCMLQRKAAEGDYSEADRQAAAERFKMMSPQKQAELEANLIGWVPARDFVFDRESFRRQLALYDDIGKADLRTRLFEFLAEIVPVAAELGLRLCIHPDDPPWPLFGLPRVVSNADDLRAILAAVDDHANGITFCSGSLGARADNDLPAMAHEFAARIHFVHLRNVKREPGGSFHESEHLGGDNDMVAIVQAVKAEEKRRRALGAPDAELPFRPDHGHRILDDMNKKVNPGYSAIGRLKGLAELRGIIRTLDALDKG